MSRRKRIIKQRATLLIVGEGHTEAAFLKHLISLYCQNRQGPKVTVRNAWGKGPENVVKTVIAHCKRAEYDQTAALLDTDLTWTPALKNKARKNSITLIGNSPCIEALFLRLHDRIPPDSSDDCKRQIELILGSKKLTQVSAYQDWCTREFLDQGAQHINELSMLLDLYKSP